MDKIYFSKMREGAVVPSKRAEDAGYDFYACFEEDYFEIKPHETKGVPTGIAWACDPKYYLQIEERSSVGSKGIKKSAGVVDSGYRGEIICAITNSTDKTFIISKHDVEKLSTSYPHLNIKNVIVHPYGKAIVQGVVHLVPQLDLEEIPYEELKKISSMRGDGAFGSTKK